MAAILLTSCAPVAQSSSFATSPTAPSVTTPPPTSPIINPPTTLFTTSPTTLFTTSPTTSTPQLPLEYEYSVVASYPHDTGAFTEGLVYDGGFLYEGTGMIGQSSLRKADLETGRVLQSEELPSPFFGEGVTTFGDRVCQLTWKSKVGFIYDKTSFEVKQKFSYSTEGWGLTHDDNSLIMSDGTRTLYYVDPETLSVTRTLEVTGGPEMIGVMRLNELEYVDGDIYANVWPTDFIVIVDAATGVVTGWSNLGGILGNEQTKSVDVLNGIAYDASDNRLFVTGKYWPRLFEIKLTPGK